MKAVERKTILTTCRQYRCCLWREWDRLNPSYAMFVGLNPSTSDEVKDDHTIKICVGYAKRWHYGALCMVNLFAYRATKPTRMKAHSSPVEADNEDNNRWLVRLAKNAGVIVAAWGVNGTHLQRDEEVMHLLAGKLSCLAMTKGGHPHHPIGLDKSLKPISFA